MTNDILRKEVMTSLKNIATDSKFNSLEKPKQIMLIKDEWTIESDMLTPTMKTKRNTAKKVYEKEIVAMYLEGVVQF